MLRTWCEQAIEDVGMPVEVYSKFFKSPIKDGKFDPPPDMRTPYLIALECDGEIKEARLYSDGPSEIWGTSYGKRGSSGYRLTGDPAVKYDSDRKHFFLLTGDTFSCAFIQYVPNIDVKGALGEAEVHRLSRIALDQYLSLKWTRRERAQDRSAVPLSEVDTELRLYNQKAPQAYGKMKQTSTAQMRAYAMERFYKMAGQVSRNL